MEIPGLRFNVLAYVETHSYEDGGREGFVCCDISSERKTEFVTWRIGFPPNSDPIMSFGHYSRNRNEALADFVFRLNGHFGPLI